MQSAVVSRCAVSGLLRIFRTEVRNLVLLQNTNEASSIAFPMATLASQRTKLMYSNEESGVFERSAHQPMTFMVVGLGNHDLPTTRHSVGMQVVDKMAAYLDASWMKDAQNCAGYVATTEIAPSIRLVLLKPKMPMNVNGTSVAKAAQYFDVSPDCVYLIHDDIDKGLGKVMLKEGGSACGHNGVRSIMNSLRTNVMPRLRIGIDRPADKNDVSDYVLSDFTSSEQQEVKRAVDKCLVSIADHLAKRTGLDVRENMSWIPQKKS